MHVRSALRSTLFAAALIGLQSLPVVAAPAPAINKAVVKVFATASAPDLQRPWQRAGMASYVGSGVILESRMILTNAHNVAYGVSIDVKLEGATERYPAKVAFISHAADLALLTIDDPAFYAGSRHLDLGAMPAVQDEVEVFGYPEGGESMSITAGVVSRIEIGNYAHSMADLLLMQIDAAINPGNSGGPVVADGRIVGIATQVLKDSQSIGYVVPLPVIRQFLADTKDGEVHGPQALGVGTQNLESPAHRARHGLGPRETGVVVIAVNHGAPAWGVLEPGDVITAIDGQAVANDLSVASNYGVRMAWVGLLAEKQAGEMVDVRIVRDGQRRDVSIRLNPWERLVPGTHMSDVTRYRIFGGLVFQPLTLDYLFLDDENMDYELATIALQYNLRTPERAQVLILTNVLPGEASRGYDGANLIIARVQGQIPRDLAHLNEIIDTATGQWLEIETYTTFRFVLDLEQARRTTPEILAKFAIGADRSPANATTLGERVE
jgi:S1-C subfamily serine protease